MKNNRYTIAALALCVLSFGASAATPVPPSGHQDHTQAGIAKASDVEAGANIAPGAPTTGKCAYAGGRRVVLILQAIVSRAV